MKTLPNGVTVFNATPHVIRFWHPDWEEPVEVDTDAIINASISEKRVLATAYLNPKLEYVSTHFDGNEAGKVVAIGAYEAGADVVIGSLIAAQAYPGLVVAMVAADGYERVAPAEKRMRPDKFTVF